MPRIRKEYRDCLEGPAGCLHPANRKAPDGHGASARSRSRRILCGRGSKGGIRKAVLSGSKTEIVPSHWRGMYREPPRRGLHKDGVHLGGRARFPMSHRTPDALRHRGLKPPVGAIATSLFDALGARHRNTGAHVPPEGPAGRGGRPEGGSCRIEASKETAECCCHPREIATDPICFLVDGEAGIHPSPQQSLARRGNPRSRAMSAKRSLPIPAGCPDGELPRPDQGLSNADPGDGGHRHLPRAGIPEGTKWSSLKLAWRVNPEAYIRWFRDPTKSFAQERERAESNPWAVSIQMPTFSGSEPGTTPASPRSTRGRTGIMWLPSTGVALGGARMYAMEHGHPGCKPPRDPGSRRLHGDPLKEHSQRQYPWLQSFRCGRFRWCGSGSPKLNAAPLPEWRFGDDASEQCRLGQGPGGNENGRDVGWLQSQGIEGSGSTDGRFARPCRLSARCTVSCTIRPKDARCCGR